MQEIKIECEVITPMFLSGADGKTAELRPPSIKGAMRFWWRAIKGLDDINELRKQESEIFGSSDENCGKSKFSIRIEVEQETKKNNLRNYCNDFINQYQGIAFLLYSTFTQRNREKEYYDIGTKFKVIFTANHEEVLKKVAATFWLTVYLGGIGTRARRGGGCIKISRVEPENQFIDFIPQASNSDELANWLIQNFKKVDELINGQNNRNSFIFSYSNLSFCRFVISNEGKNNWKDALNEIGKIYKGFRDAHRQDVFETGAFGFPIRHRNGEILGSKNYNRRSSPLIIKVLCSQNNFYWFVLRLAGEFLPEGEVLIFNNRTQKPDYTLIDEFWKKLENNGKEHILHTSDQLNSIIEKIKKNVNPNKIILFGSRARGDAHKNSDIDIAVDSDKSIENISIEAPVDLVNLKKVGDSLKEKIKREGVIIYERKS